MARRTILFCSGGVHLGGAEKSLLELTGRMCREAGIPYAPHVVLPRGGGPLEGALDERDVPYSVVSLDLDLLSLSREEWWRLPGHIVDVQAYYDRLTDVAERVDPVLVHSNAVKLHLLTGLRSLWTDTPVLWHMRDILDGGAVLKALRLIARLPKVNVVANSRATAAAFRPPDGDGVHVVHNALDSEEYRLARHTELHDEFGLRDDRPIVAAVGALADWKGQLEFIRCAAEVLESGREAFFLVVGEEIYDTFDQPGQYRRTLEREVQRLGLEDHVAFTGFIEDVPWLLNGLDVLVHPSIEPEPFGRVIIEAMACGVPLTASAAGGVLEIIDRGETGLLHGPGDVGGMAENVCRLLDDPELRRSLSDRGRRAFEERFTMDALCDRVVGLYDRLSVR